MLLERVSVAKVPGGFVETGTWRGGVSIFARAVQKALGEGERRDVWVADSYEGLPKASTQLDNNEWATQSKKSQYVKSCGYPSFSFAVSLEDVKENFRRFF